MSGAPFDKRTYARGWARRRRDRELLAKRARACRCPYRSGTYECHGLLTYTVDQMGKAHAHCPRCARREAGICQDCPLPVEGRVRSALRCRACKRRAGLEANRRYRLRHLEERRAVDAAHQRRYRAANPEKGRARAREYRRVHRAERYAYTKRWRAANPDKMRAMRKRWARNRKERLRAQEQAA